MATVVIGSNIASSAFKNQTTITSVKFGSRCSIVNKDAFKACISLSEINDDNEITLIYNGAFTKTAISTATFNKLTNITNSLNDFTIGAFEKCLKLSYVNMPICSTIDSGTFKECSELIEINIPKCNNIKSNAFIGCGNLISVNISAQNISIGNSAFNNCKKLKYFNFKNCNIIGDNAFLNCFELEEANLTNCYGKQKSETFNIAIGSSAFYNCSNLKKIYLSNNLGIGEEAFYNCENLTKVIITSKKEKENYIIPLSGYPFNPSYTNIRYYLETDIYNDYKNINDSSDDSYKYWSVYKDYMIKIPGENEILYTTYDEQEIDLNKLKENYGEISKNYYVVNGYIQFEKSIRILKGDGFKNQTNLISINLPSLCEEIGDNVFEGCTKLDTITPSLKTDLKKIGEYAFKNCTSLTSFTIPESIEELGDGVFAGCTNIESFYGKFVKYNNQAIVKDNTLICVLPKSNKKIYDISDIDSNITKLGKSCFYGCNSALKIIIPSNITHISDYAFDGCNNIREIHFLDANIESVSENAFGFLKDTDGNGRYTHEYFKIFVPENLFKKFMEYKWIYKYKNLIYPKPNDNQIIYYGSSKLANSDEQIQDSNNNGNYYKRTLSGNSIGLTGDISTITKIILGENITTINDNAFKNCQELEYIYIPSNITKFGNECFYGCNNLKSIFIPNTSLPKNPNKGKTSFGNNIFYKCTNLKKFWSYSDTFISGDGRCYIDDGKLKFFAEGYLENANYVLDERISKIDISAFKGVTSIDTIDVNKVTSIGESAFEGNNLQNIYWDNVTEIQTKAFKDCTSLKGISLPENLNIIGVSAFEGCNQMYITQQMPTTVTEIGASAFKECKAFRYSDNNETKALTLGNINCINNYTFYKCKTLGAVRLSDNITTIGDHSFGESGIYKVDVTTASNLNSIGYRAFDNCEHLKIFAIPKKIKHIDDYAFYGCKEYVESITLNSVETIGKYCFELSGITGLDISKSTLTYINEGSFKDCKKLNTVNLPDSIERVKPYAFNGCISITKIDLPSSLSKIEKYSFSTNSSATKIYIPSVMLIPPKFTLGVREDTTGTVYPFGKIGEQNIPTIYIPSMPMSLISTYKNDKHWKKYANYIYSHSIVSVGSTNMNV